MTETHQRRARSEIGALSGEAAIMIGVVLVMTLGIIDFYRYSIASQFIRSAANTGVTYASVNSAILVDGEGPSDDHEDYLDVKEDAETKALDHLISLAGDEGRWFTGTPSFTLEIPGEDGTPIAERVRSGPLTMTFDAGFNSITGFIDFESLKFSGNISAYAEPDFTSSQPELRDCRGLRLLPSDLHSDETEYYPGGQCPCNGDPLRWNYTLNEYGYAQPLPEGDCECRPDLVEIDGQCQCPWPEQEMIPMSESYAHGGGEGGSYFYINYAFACYCPCGYGEMQADDISAGCDCQCAHGAIEDDEGNCECPPGMEFESSGEWALCSCDDSSCGLNTAVTYNMTDEECQCQCLGGYEHSSADAQNYIDTGIYHCTGCEDAYVKDDDTEECICNEDAYCDTVPYATPILDGTCGCECVPPATGDFPDCACPENPGRIDPDDCSCISCVSDPDYGDGYWADKNDNCECQCYTSRGFEGPDCECNLDPDSCEGDTPIAWYPGNGHNSWCACMPCLDSGLDGFENSYEGDNACGCGDSVAAEAACHAKGNKWKFRLTDRGCQCQYDFEPCEGPAERWGPRGDGEGDTGCNCWPEDGDDECNGDWTYDEGGYCSCQCIPDTPCEEIAFGMELIADEDEGICECACPDGRDPFYIPPFGPSVCLPDSCGEYETDCTFEPPDTWVFPE